MTSIRKDCTSLSLSLSTILNATVSEIGYKRIYTYPYVDMISSYYLYIYIYRERERETEREKQREKEILLHGAEKDRKNY